MTSWQGPERPVLRARPPKQFRDPAAPRRRLIGDDRWLFGGLALAVGLLFGYVGYWTNWFGLTAPPTPVVDATAVPGGPGNAPAAGGTTTGGLIVLGVFAVLVLGLVLWIVVGSRERGPRLDRLPEDEQARRRQVAALLREVEPPVSEEAAQAALHPAWLDEAASRAAHPPPGGNDPDE